MKFLFLTTLVFFSSFKSSFAKLNFVVGATRINCDPKLKEEEKCPTCPGEKPPPQYASFYKCKTKLKSETCLKYKTRKATPAEIRESKGKVKLVETNKCQKGGKSYTVNILINRAVLESKEPIDLTYFLHGRLNSGKVDGKNGAVGRYAIEEKIKDSFKPIAFVYPEHIHSRASKEYNHFSQFNTEARWKVFQDTVEQFLGGSQKIGNRNLMAHSMAYVPVSRMHKWKDIRFNSTIMLDSIYGRYDNFKSIIQRPDHFGKFTSYSIERKDKSPPPGGKTHYNNGRLLDHLDSGAEKEKRHTLIEDLSRGSPKIIRLKRRTKNPAETTIVDHANISGFVYDRYLEQRGLVKHIPYPEEFR